MILELTRPDNSKQTVRLEDDTTCMIESWIIQEPNSTVTLVGSRLSIAGFGNIIVRETYEELQEKIFKPKLASVHSFSGAPPPIFVGSPKEAEAFNKERPHLNFNFPEPEAQVTERPHVLDLPCWCGEVHKP